MHVSVDVPLEQKLAVGDDWRPAERPVTAGGADAHCEVDYQTLRQPQPRQRLWHTHLHVQVAVGTTRSHKLLLLSWTLEVGQIAELDDLPQSIEIRTKLRTPEWIIHTHTQLCRIIIHKVEIRLQVWGCAVNGKELVVFYIGCN